MARSDSKTGAYRETGLEEVVEVFCGLHACVGRVGTIEQVDQWRGSGHLAREDETTEKSVTVYKTTSIASMKRSCGTVIVRGHAPHSNSRKLGSITAEAEGTVELMC